MRIFALAAALSVLMPSAANAQAWVAQCRGDKDLQYNQTIGGAGALDLPVGDGTYQTLPLRQTFYDGKMVCGATDPKAAAANSIAQVCADKAHQNIHLKYRELNATGAPSEKDVVYCDALINAY